MIRTYPSANAEGLISIHVIYNDFCLQAEQKQKVRRPTTWYHWTNNISGDRHTPMDLLECQRIYGAIAPTDPFRPEESNGEEWDMRDARGLPISYTIISFTYRLQDPSHHLIVGMRLLTTYILRVYYTDHDLFGAVPVSTESFKTGEYWQSDKPKTVPKGPKTWYGYCLHQADEREAENNKSIGNICLPKQMATDHSSR